MWKKIMLSALIITLLTGGILVFAQNWNHQQTDEQKNPELNISPQNNTELNNTQINPNTNQRINNMSSGSVNVFLSLHGPKRGHQGQDVLITYTIKNKSPKPLYNVTIYGQDVYKELGTLKPKKTITYTCKIHIPTDIEEKEEHGPEAAIGNSYIIGGDKLLFVDFKGVSHEQYFNVWKIKLT